MFKLQKKKSARLERQLKRLRDAAFYDAGGEESSSDSNRRELDLSVASQFSGGDIASSACAHPPPSPGSAVMDANDTIFPEQATRPAAAEEGLSSFPDIGESTSCQGRPAGGRLRQPESGEDVGNFFAGMQARREVPISVMSEIVDYLVVNRAVVTKALLDGELKNFRVMRYHAVQAGPAVCFDVACTQEDGETYMFTGLSTFPKKAIAAKKLVVDYVLCHVPFEGILKLYEELHPEAGRPAEMDLSLDGIPESKSSGLSTDILSVRFVGCRQVYTVAILQPARKAMQLADSIILERLLAEFPSTGLRLRRVIADAPKRASLQGMKQHSATYSCPYCTARKVDKKFPASVRGDPRSDNEIRDMVRLIAAGEDDDELLKGVKQASPLANAGIDLVKDVPAEKMHLCDLGIVRKIMQLSYKCVAFRAMDVPFVRSNDKELTLRLLAIKCLPEFSRRTRAVDLANYKAEEFRNLVLCFWPAVYATLPDPAKEVWLLTVFIIRAANLDPPWYDKFCEYYDIQNLLDRWYAMFERSFTVRHCTYNVHVFGRHLAQVRAVGPLHETSAVVYESHYNVIKRSTRPGTPSTGKQALVNSLLAAKYKHNCNRSRKLSGHETTRTDDTICYLADGTLVKATTAAVDGMFQAYILGKRTSFNATEGLDFNSVLCFKLDGRNRESESTYRLRNVVGKCVVVDDVVSVVPWAVLHDS